LPVAAVFPTNSSARLSECDTFFTLENPRHQLARLRLRNVRRKSIVTPLTVSGLVFACIAGAGVLAMLIARALPGHHLQADSRDTIKQGLGMIATLAALVLALLVAAAKGSYDTHTNSVRQLAADVLMLDRVLALYGPQTAEARDLLRRGVTATLDRIWPAEDAGSANLTPGEARVAMEAFFENITGLTPKTESQRALKARALEVATGLMQTRLRLFAQKDSTIPVPFLVVLVFWLMILLGGFALLSPCNATVVSVLLVCTLSVSCAIFLILELDRPFHGMVRVSSVPLREALSLVGN